MMDELGRYPLLHEVFLNMIKYLARLNELQDCLAADAFNVSKQLFINNKFSWYHCIKEILEHFNINENMLLGSKNKMKHSIYKLFHVNYNDLWKKRLLDDRNNMLSYGNKLCTYRLFKDNF